MKDREIPTERFDRDVDWPDPAPEPGEEPADSHTTIPLDDDDDRHWLRDDDPRRRAAEGEGERHRRHLFGHKEDK